MLCILEGVDADAGVNSEASAGSGSGVAGSRCVHTGSGV